MKIKCNAIVPKYNDGDHVLFGINLFQDTCECGHTTHVLNIGIGLVWVQFTTEHNH